MDDQGLRDHLAKYLRQGHAHASVGEAVKNFPEDLINDKPQSAPYTFWALLEHIRLTQRDMLDFIRDPNYKEKNWPADYWPDEGKTAELAMWNKTLEDYVRDLDDLIEIISDEKNDLLKKIPHGKSQTVFQEVLQILDHASYHTGEFILMRRIAGQWK